MKNDLGFFALTLENTTLHENICKLISLYIENNKDKQIVFFNQYCEKINTYNIPILPISYSKYYNGDLVVFDMASLLIAVNSIKAENIYFYANNIPWQASYSGYGDWKAIFGNKKLKVIAENKYLYDIYNIVWDNSLGVCEEIVYEKFCKLVR